MSATLVERLTKLVDLKRKYPDGITSCMGLDLSEYNGHSIAFYNHNADDIEQLLAVAARAVELEEGLRTMWMFFAGKAKTELPEKDYREIRNLLTPSIKDKKATS